MFSLVIFTAWVGGYLDPLQHSLQDMILGKMGDNRASYGVKSMLRLNSGSIPYNPKVERHC